jgi:glycosyltransferase involved in cell wall biosynthesis
MPRVVIAHDYLATYGGAERVTQEMAATFPGAPVVSILGREEVARRMGLADRWSSVLPPRTRLLRDYRLLAPAMPALVRAHRLPEADVLLTSSYAFAHHFRTPSRAPQVCFCHSPLRFAWSMGDDYRQIWTHGRVSRLAFDAVAAGLRRSDRRAAETVTTYLTPSPFTALQIELFYDRPATVIGAPVDCERFRPAPGGDHDDYFLLCGRLVEPYKNMGNAIRAFRELDARLLIAGDGPARAELQALAGPNVAFLGHLDDDRLVGVIQRAAALLFPSRDDFGLMPLEAMACGRPVLAHDGGGARHTVVRGVTGERFRGQTPEAIAEAVDAFRADDYDPAIVRSHAERWDRVAFRARVGKAVSEALR